MGPGRQGVGRRPKTDSDCLPAVPKAGLVSGLTQEIPSYKQSHIPEVYSYVYFLNCEACVFHGNNILNVLNDKLASLRSIY